jgi:hypothetical protein
MRPSFQYLRCGLFLLTIATLLAGCQHCGEKNCNDIPAGAIPQPCGTYMCQWMHAERARADRDNFVIYQYEWQSNTAKLNATGEEHLANIARRLAETQFAVVIEPTTDDKLNESRRAGIIETLANHNVPVGPDCVVLGHSEAEPLRGQEATAISQRLLNAGTTGTGGQGGASTGGGAQGGLGGTGGTGSVGGGSAVGGGMY